jgi:hypothetical protein
MNGDGKPDILTSARKGAFIFFNNVNNKRWRQDFLIGPRLPLPPPVKPYEVAQGRLVYKAIRVPIEFRNLVVPLNERMSNKKREEEHEISIVGGVRVAGQFFAGACELRPPASRWSGAPKLAHIFGRLYQ